MDDDSAEAHHLDPGHAHAHNPDHPAPTPPRERLPLGLQLQYAGGAIVEGVAGTAVGTFLLFYLTSVAGLSGAQAGAALALGIIVDAVVDPAIGASSDDLRSRLGRRLPFMLVGLPVLAVAMALLMGLPAGWSKSATFACATGLSIATRVSLSLYAIPHQAVAAELTEDYTERSVLLAWRWAVQTLASVATVVVGFDLFFSGPGGVTRRAAYAPFGLTLAAMIVVGGLIGAAAVWFTRSRQHVPPPEPRRGAFAILHDMAEVFRSRSFWALAGCGLLVLAGLGVQGSLGIHANTWFWRLAPSQLQILPLLTLAGIMAGTPMAVPLTRLLGKRILVVAGLIALCLLLLLPPLMRIAGLLPLEGMPLVAVLGASLAVVGAMVAVATVALGSMLADATDEHEYLFGSRREGLYFSAWLFAGKAANGLGVLVAGLLLQVVRFPAHIPAGAVIAPLLPKATLTTFGLLYSIGPALLVLGSIACIAFYRLDATRHAEILAALHARRGRRQHANSPSP
jgi:GPH family glycoside/pentoside/hexuronide:cation symporter